VPAEPRSPLALARTELPDGTLVVSQPSPAGSPSFAISYLAPSGWAFDPRGAEGLALLTSELGVCGAGRRNRAEIARVLDRLGATLGSQCHPECSELTLWGPRSHWEELLPLLTEAITVPRFEPRELDRVRRQLLERQMRERTQPDRSAEKRLLSRIFADHHPYRETGLGRASAVRRVRRNDVVRFHAARAREGGAVLAVTGLPSLDAFGRRWHALMPEGAPGGRSGPPTLPSQRTPARPVDRIEVPGGSQVEIRMGGPGIPRSDPAYPAAYLANDVLGGRGTLSRLFQVLREGRGLVYSASSEVEAMTWGGYWVAEAGTDPKKVDRVCRLMEGELAKIAEREVPTTELDRIRTSAIGSLALELESTADAHELAVDVAYNRLPTDFYATWPETLRALTPRAVREAAEPLFDPARTATVLAGALGGGTPNRR
jgi:zinc protease